jgi:hypothetical protein
MMSADLTSKAVVAEHKWSQNAAELLERAPCYNWRKTLTPSLSFSQILKKILSSPPPKMTS